MSKIEWTQQTWNPIVGCSIVSPGCTNCYAMKMAARLELMTPDSHYKGTTRKVNGNAVWTGKLALASDETLLAPLRRKKPTTYFVNSMGDLFHEDVPDAWIDKVFAIMALCPQHTFQCLTKRSKRMREYVNDQTQARRDSKGAAVLALGGITDGLPWPLPNVWLGVSAEDQTRADERIPDLLATPAAVRFVSAEPLLGPIDFEPWLHWSEDTEVNGKEWGCIECDTTCSDCPQQKAVWLVKEGPRDADGCPEWVTSDRTTLDWIIVGGESGPGARPMHPQWARTIRDQCKAAGTAFFFKQWGEFAEVDIYNSPNTVVVDNSSDEAERWLAATKKPSWITLDGRHITSRSKLPKDTPCRLIDHVGKARAGRLLDGIEHNAMPDTKP